MGIRVWLALAFALVAAVTAIAERGARRLYADTSSELRATVLGRTPGRGTTARLRLPAAAEQAA